jgi:type I restriction enzyme S subunit
MTSKDVMFREEKAIATENMALPEGWGWARLGDVSIARLGKTPRRTEYRDAGVHRIVKFRDVTEEGIDYSANKAAYVLDAPSVLKALRPLHLGDVLITASAHSGDQIGKKCAYVDHLPVVDGGVFFVGELLSVTTDPQVLESKWAYYWFKSEDGIRAVQSAVAGVHLTAGCAQNIPIPLASQVEQKRIVAKIEELLPRVNAVRERLIRVKEIMKRFRQSVLSAACSGILTVGWRAMRPNVQKAAELVEEVQLKENRLYTQKCEKAKRNGKGKPRRPSILELKEIDSHPEIESWATLRMDYAFRPDGLFDGPFGSNLKTVDYTQQGVRVVRIENIGFLSFLEEKRTYIDTPKYETLRKHTVREGDLIFASFVSDGVRAVVLPKIEKAIAKADCFCLRPLPKLLDIRYLAMILSSRQTYSELIGGIHGATRPRITTKQLRNLNIPLAPLEEQREIVDRVESLFKLADRIEKRIEAELSRTEEITQAILAKAFRGELVPTEVELERGAGKMTSFPGRDICHG